MMGPHLAACLRNDKLGEPCFYLMGQNQATVCKGRFVCVNPCCHPATHYKPRLGTRVLLPHPLSSHPVNPSSRWPLIACSVDLCSDACVMDSVWMCGHCNALISLIAQMGECYKNLPGSHTQKKIVLQNIKKIKIKKSLLLLPIEQVLLDLPISKQDFVFWTCDEKI